MKRLGLRLRRPEASRSFKGPRTKPTVNIWADSSLPDACRTGGTSALKVGTEVHRRFDALGITDLYF